VTSHATPPPKGVESIRAGAPPELLAPAETRTVTAADRYLARAEGARLLAARLLERFDMVAESLTTLRAWRCRRAIRELLARELAATLGEPQPPWGELGDAALGRELRRLIGGRP
jgi:hypothetical protein